MRSHIGWRRNGLKQKYLPAVNFDGDLDYFILFLEIFDLKMSF